MELFASYADYQTSIRVPGSDFDQVLTTVGALVAVVLVIVIGVLLVETLWPEKK